MNADVMALALLQSIVNLKVAISYLTVAVSFIPVAILFSVLLAEIRQRRAEKLVRSAFNNYTKWSL
jgi:hypothetical protein